MSPAQPEKPGSLIGRFRSARRDASLAVLEGLHALKHAHRFGAELLELVVSAPPQATSPVDAPVDPHAPLSAHSIAHSLARSLAPDLLPVLDRARVVAADVFAQLAPVPHATGVIALARRPAVDAEVAFTDELSRPIVLLERPSHLSNIGAAVRVAAAANAAGLFTLRGEDPWQAVALRGGAGLQFALPCARIDTLPPTQRPLIALDPDGDPLDSVALPANAIFAFGTERGGLSAELRARAAARARIPMRPGVSSLNLATAVAVVLYCT